MHDVLDTIVRLHLWSSNPYSLASQPYFSACACMHVIEGGGGREGKIRLTVFVSNGNVISAFGHAIIT